MTVTFQEGSVARRRSERARRRNGDSSAGRGGRDVEQLEAELRLCKERLAELRAEHDKALALNTEMREHLEDVAAHRESWVEALRLVLNADGKYVRDEEADVMVWYAELLQKHNDLVAKWNKFVPRYNSTVSPRPRGRPLDASEAQVADVLKRHKAGESLRKIAGATALSFSTVRTIVAGKDRSRELRRREFDKHRAREFRARKRLHDNEPKQMTEERETSERLIKAAKGLA
jgi:hypothetical protein